jgi:hypothetical protein
MTFDSNRAWLHATAVLRANREVLIALAGVFFLLPILAFTLFFPQPTPPAGADEAAMLAFASQYYARTMPFALPMGAVQAAGTLGLLTLLTDRTRPTVGQAIRTGFAALLPYLGAQILLGLAAGLAGIVLLTILGLSGSKALISAGLAGLGAAGIYVWVRMSLSAPVVAVEGVRSPLKALRRSWALTRGNGLRIAVFYALIVVVFMVVMSLTMALTGLLFAALLPANLAVILAAVISATLQAVMALTLVAALAAVHAQLAGDTPERISATFD